MQTDPFVDQQVLLKLPISEYPQVCSTNQHYRQLCNSESFWHQKYQKHGLLLLEPKSGLPEYLQDFQTCEKILSLVPLFLQKCKERIEHEDWIEYNIPSVIMNSVNDFNIPEVNIERLRRLIDRHRFRDFSNIDEETFDLTLDLPEKTLYAEIGYSYSLKSFYLMFISYFQQGQAYYREGFKINISESSARTLFYVWLYRRYRIDINTAGETYEQEIDIEFV